MTPRCTEQHRGRSMLGTAPEQSEWLLVGIPKPWPPKVEKLEAVQALKGRAKVIATTEPGVRVLQRRDGRIRYAEGSDGEHEAPCPQLLLVCTHGSRDPCCGQLGPPLIQRLRELGATVLECSHLGGHRFAPTILAFPEFRCFGGVTPERAEEFWNALREGKPQPDFYRGATYLDKTTQLAEGAVWRHTGRMPVSVELRSREEGKLEVAADGQDYTVCYESQPYRAIASCGEEESEEWLDVKILSCEPRR